MKAEDQLPRIFLEADDRDTQKGRLGEIEAAPLIGAQVRLDPLLALAGRDTAPVLLSDRQRRLAMDHLKRFVQALGMKRRPQHRVAGDRALPRRDEQRRIEAPLALPRNLLEVNAGLRRRERVQQHPLLQRRELVDALDVARTSRHDFPPAPIRAISRSS